MEKPVILLTKRDRFSQQAQIIARSAFPNLKVFEGTVGDPEPQALSTDTPAYLISFLSPWIVRKASLDNSAVAINFHPGPVEYPGTGCYNFALYDDAPEYGAVCHHMLPKVDTGRLILERRFPVSRRDSVETLKLATMETMLGMFKEIVGLIAEGAPLPAAATHWTRKPFTHREMEALKDLDWTMSPDEITRRKRATVYPGYPGPRLRQRDGSTVRFPVPARAAVA